MLLIGRQGDAVGPRQVLDDQLELGIVRRRACFMREGVRETKDAIERQLFLRISVTLRRQAIRRIGEIERAV